MCVCIMQNHIGQMHARTVLHVLLTTDFDELKHEFYSFSL